MDIEIKDSTIEDLSYYAKMIFDEMEARYDDLSALYGALHDDYNELQEKYEDLKQEESEPQYDYKAYNEGFENGEYSMQKKAYKICEYWNDNNTAALIALFDGMVLSQIFEDIETAYNKIAEYERKEKEIKVGDEVVDCDGTKYVVRFLNDSYVDALAYNGVSVECDYADVSKTGKHYPLEEMLKELK